MAPTAPRRTPGLTPAVATALVILSLALAIGAQALQLARTYLFAPPMLNLTAIVLLAAALWSRRRHETPPIDPPPRPTDVRSIWIGRIFILFGAALAAYCSVWLYRDWVAALPAVFLAGPLAVLHLATGQDILLGYADRWPLSWARLRAALDKREVRAMLAVVLLAAVFRFLTVGDFPPTDGFSSIEETQRATGALSILEREGRPWEFPLPQYLAAGAFWLFGYNIHALRVPVTILGCLTMIPFYLLVREFTAVPAALLATTLLAVSRWHVQVSWYNEDVYTPLSVFVLILFLLVRTRREPRPMYYAALGACCAYTLYDYAGFRGTSLIVFAFLAGEVLRARRLPPDWRQLVLFLAVWALCALPLVGIVQRMGVDLYFEALGRSFANKSYYTTDALAFLAQRLARIRQAADMFTFTDHEDFFYSLNTGGAPLLDPVTSVAFVLGLGVTLLHLRTRFHALFGVAFLFLATGATVVVQNLDFRRLAALVPFVFVFIAIIADKLNRFAIERGAQRLARMAFALLAIAAGAANYHFLFRVLAPNHGVRANHRDDYTVAAFYLRDHHRGEHVVLLTPFIHNFFLGNDYDWIKPKGLRGQVALGPEGLFPFDPPVPQDTDALLLVQRRFEIGTILEQVTAFYPGATCELRKDPDSLRFDLGVCRVPAAAMRAAGNPWEAAAPPAGSG